MNESCSKSEILKVEAGNHVLCLYKNDEEHWNTVIPYLLEGVEKGERVLYFCPPDIAKTAKQKLIETHDKAERYIEKELITFFTDDRIFLRDGVFNPFDVIAFFYAETQRALSEGFRAVRIAQEMAWGEKMVEEGNLLAQHDIALNNFIKTKDCSLLCLYDERKFEPRVLVNILKGHPLIFAQNRLMKNFYYIPPTDEMILEIAPIDLNYMLTSLIKHHDFEEMGRMSADQLAIVFRNVPIAMFIVDKDRKIERINDKALNLLSSETNDILGKKFGDAIRCINSFDNEMGCGFGTNCGECPIRKAVATTFEEGHSQLNLEAKVTSLYHGEPKTSYYLVSTCLLDKEDKAVLVCLLDITEIKDAENKLKREMDKSEKLLSIAADMIIVLDMNGNVQKVNRRACEILGYKEEEILGKNWFDNFIPERDREEIKQVFSTIKMGNTEIYERYQNSILTKKGDERIIEWNNSVILDKKGEIEGIISSGRDITEQIKTVEKLKTSEEMYRLITENVSDVIWTVDLNLGFKYISPSVEKLLGYTVEETWRLKFSDILTPDAYNKMMEIHKEQQNLRESNKADARKNITLELEARKKDGTTIWTETNLSYLTDAEGKINGILGITRDISPKKNMIFMDRLIQLGQIAAAIVHDINNPTSYLMSNNAFLSETIKDMDDNLNKLANFADNVENEKLKNSIFDLLSKQKNFIKGMKDAVEENKGGLNRIKDIASKLRTFARADSDEVGIVNINEEINSAITMVYNQISQVANFNKSLEEPLPTITGKSGRLSQMFMNLLVNAVHAVAEKGGKKEQNYIRVNSRREGNGILVTIEDSGTGIRENIRGKIFDEFFTTKRKDLGTGLGLSLCKKTVMEHNGEITFESEMGKGTVFKVFLPLDTGLEISDKIYQKTNKEFLSPRAKILFVDDEPNFVKSMQRLLGRKHKIIAAESGAEALAYLTTDSDFDVIVCDLMMPDINGKMLYETICASFPHLRNKFIFVTGGTFNAEATQFLSEIEKSHPCLYKPISEEEISNTINQLLEKKFY